MKISELEKELEAAKERIRQAMKALAPKHKGGEKEEARSAYIALLALERQLAAARGEEYAEPLDFPVRWDIGAPMPHLLANGLNTFLIFYVRVDDPNWDGSYARIRNLEANISEPLALVQFHQCTSVKLGAPNDEVLNGHPLSGKGLESYTAQVVRNSKWIAELEAVNKVHNNYTPEAWRNLNHYVFWFHDETFECVARSYEIEVVNISLLDLLFRVGARLVK